ncbi:MAG: WGxxGxxG-CTERM domain-containing protein [Coleofasciculus sp. S288]|nr:WGxxGxxG-CTERM domain-containing protein [Coleofasciculus sp. S288]
MKFSSVSKFLGAGAIAASLVVVPLTLPAQAQDNAPDTTAQPVPPNPLPEHTERDDRDWGWLGLLGLAGLAGLAGRKRPETVHHVNGEPGASVRSGSNYQ